VGFALAGSGKTEQWSESLPMMGIGELRNADPVPDAGGGGAEAGTWHGCW
jgi:hypothetical protein